MLPGEGLVKEEAAKAKPEQQKSHTAKLMEAQSQLEAAANAAQKAGDYPAHALLHAAYVSINDLMLRLKAAKPHLAKYGKAD
jgi:hypothetical protein